jgi:hypothetical protein
MGDCYFVANRKVIVLPSEMFWDIFDPTNRKDSVEKPRGMNGVTTDDVMMELNKYINCGGAGFSFTRRTSTTSSSLREPFIER